MHRLGVALRQRRREVALELVREVGILGHVRVEQLRVQEHLRVGEQHRQLRPRQAAPLAGALGDLLVVGQRLEPAVELRVLLERADEALVDVEHRGRLRLGHRERLALLVVVLQDEVGDRLGHVDEQGVALLDGHVAGVHDGVEQDLDVDLAVGAVDARRVVDRVRVDAARRPSAYSIRAALRQPEVAALADRPCSAARSRRRAGCRSSCRRRPRASRWTPSRRCRCRRSRAGRRAPSAAPGSRRSARAWSARRRARRAPRRTARSPWRSAARRRRPSRSARCRSRTTTSAAARRGACAPPSSARGRGRGR